MTQISPEKMEIYDLLRGRQMTISEIVDAVGRDNSTVRYHIRGLQKEGLVWRKIRNVTVNKSNRPVNFYSARPVSVPIEDKPWVKS